MQRSSFFKSLLGLIVAPKIISEIDWVPEKKTQSQLFNELNLIIPDYLPQLYERCGNEDYSEMLTKMGRYEDNQPQNEFYWSHEHFKNI